MRVTAALILLTAPLVMWAGQGPASVSGPNPDIFAILGGITGLVALVMGNPWVFVPLAANGMNIAILAPICFVLGLVFGIIAVVRMKKNPGKFRFEKMAWLGIVLPGAMMAFWGLAFLFSLI